MSNPNSCLDLFASGKINENTLRKTNCNNSIYGIISSLESFISFLSNIDGLKSYVYTIDTLISDTEILRDKYIVANFNSAKRAYAYPICNVEKHKIFDNYVLPYKNFSERLENWRDSVQKMNIPGVFFPKDMNDYLAITRAVNNIIKLNFKFNTSSSSAYFMTFSDLMKMKRGDCIASSSLATSLLRAYGIPIAIDFTCSWGNIDGKLHAWNSIIYSERISIPFMAGEENPNYYNPLLLFRDKFNPSLTTYKRCAKIFRRVPFINKNVSDFPASLRNRLEILKDRRFIDVTKLYLPVSSVSFRVSKRNIYINYQNIYVHVFNNGQWLPVWGAEKGNVNVNKCVFKDLARNMLYIIGYYDKDKFIPLSFPFIIRENGKLNLLKPEGSQISNIVVKYLKSPELDQIDTFSNINDSKGLESLMHSIMLGNRTKPKGGKVYSLYIWNGEWKLYGSSKSSGTLSFKCVPKGCLYRIVEEKNGSKSRAFTYSNNMQEWW